MRGTGLHGTPGTHVTRRNQRVPRVTSGSRPDQGAVIANRLNVTAMGVVVPEFDTRIPAFACRLNHPVTSAGAFATPTATGVAPLIEYDTDSWSIGNPCTP